MKKWISIFAIVTLVLLLGVGSVMGIQMSKKTDMGQICSNGTWLSQVVRCDGKDYVIYKDAEQKKIRIENTVLNYQNYATLGTVHLEEIYYLYSFTGEGKNGIGISPVIEKEEWEIPAFETNGSFLASGSGEQEIYVSVLGENGRYITEYVLDMSVEEKEWRERVSFSIPEGHFVIAGAYDGEQLLAVREDGIVYSRDVVLKELDVKAEETVLASCFEHKLMDGAESIWKLNCMKEAMVKSWLPVLIGAALAALLIYGRSGQNHMIYRMISYAGMLSIVALTAAGMLFANHLVKQEIMETGVEAGYVLEEIKYVQRADGTIRSDIFWNAVKDKEKLVEDIVIANPRDGQVLLAGNLVSGMELVDYYGEKMQTLAVEITESNDIMMTQLDGDAGGCYVVASRDFTQIDAETVLLAVISEEGIEKRLETAISNTWNSIFALMIGVIIIYMIIFIVFASKWKNFLEEMQFVAKEKKAYIEKPKNNGGLSGAWGSLDQIGHNMVKLRYERDLLYRSYYRFVPKGMEQLLQKTEVADIEIGDCQKMYGTMVHFRMDSIKDMGQEDYMSVMTESLKLTHQIREKSEGIFISAGGDLLNRKIFFTQTPGEALRFAINLYHAHAARETLVHTGVVMMVHQSMYYYGVSGVQDMMTPYIYCAEEKILDRYLESLAKAGVRIVVTEATLMVIGRGFSVRYLGFVSGGEGTEEIKLYECLDAYEESKRKRMRNSNTIFQNALRLFYANDFYQARNTFKEVLRMDEQDEIARWYLFHCEYQLNRNEADVSHGLFENVIREREYDKV